MFLLKNIWDIIFDYIDGDININNKVKDIIKYIDWTNLSSNENAYYFLQYNIEYINWDTLCINNNINILSMLKNNIDKINWNTICLNTNNDIIKFLEKYPTNINWKNLCSNSSLSIFNLLENNIEKIDWFEFIYNKNFNVFLYNNIKYIDITQIYNFYKNNKYTYKLTNAFYLFLNKYQDIVITYNLYDFYDYLHHNFRGSIKDYKYIDYNQQTIIDKNIENIDFYSLSPYNINIIFKNSINNEEDYWYFISRNKTFWTFYPTYLLKQIIL